MNLIDADALIEILELDLEILESGYVRLWKLKEAIKEIAFEIDEYDLKVETYSNAKQSCVVVTHLPTGLSARCDTERLQSKARYKALAKLRDLLITSGKHTNHLGE